MHIYKSLQLELRKVKVLECFPTQAYQNHAADSTRQIYHTKHACT